MSGPQIPSTPPIIPASVNFNSNTTQTLKSQFIQSTMTSLPYSLNSSTNGIVSLSNGTLTGLITSDNPIDVATKEYSDSIPFPIPGGPIDNSIQVNAGSGLFTGYDALKWSVSNPPTLNLVGSLTNDFIIINNNRIQNIADPVLNQSAANKEYVQNTNLTPISLLTTGSSVTTNLTPTQVINTILQRTFNTTGTLDQDILPTASSIIAAIPGCIVGSAFTFIYQYVNITEPNFHVIVLYGNSTTPTASEQTNIIPKGDYFYINTSDNNINIFPETIVEFIGTVISIDAGSEVVNFYITNYQQLYINNTQQLTQLGLLTDNFFIEPNAIFNNAFVIQPLIPTAISQDTPYTYNYSDLKNLLIMRSGLTANTQDELGPMSSFLGTSTAFSMSSGSFKFVIQNVDPRFSLTFGSNADTGWTFATGSSRIIPIGYNGFFNASINTSANTATLYTLGILSRNGL